jgi:hypothetical protein
MATQEFKSLKGRTMRLTRLDACGVPVVGACSSIVTPGFITVEFAVEEEAGDEQTLKNAWGELEVSEKDADTNKWVNVTINATRVNPDVADLVAGATPLDDGTDTIGYSVGQTNNTSAFAVEVWTKMAGGACSGGTQKWGYFVAPFCLNGKFSGSVSIENGPMTMELSGEGQPAPADWGVNPYGDNPLLDSGGFPTGDLYAVALTTVQPPTATTGCVALS